MVKQTIIKLRHKTGHEQAAEPIPVTILYRYLSQITVLMLLPFKQTE